MTEKRKKRSGSMEGIGIPKLLRRNAIYLLAYGYATARRDERSETWPETVRAFIARFNLPETITEEILIREIYRMTGDLLTDGI